MRKSVLSVSAIAAMCSASMASHGGVTYALQQQAREAFAERSTIRKVKGPNATKGKRQASLKSRSNKRK